MEKTLLDLIETVEAEKDRYEQIYALSEHKKQVIIAGDAEKLEEIVAQERKLDREINEIEQKRLELLNGIALQLDIPVDEVNITAISERVSPELSQRLKKFQEEFLGLLNKQMAFNEINKQLLETQLHYIEVFLESLATSDSVNNTYGFDGTDAEANNQRTGLIDHKI